MTTVTIRYGMTNSITREFDEESTINDVLNDRGILGALNAPEGCVAVSSGETCQSGDALAGYTTLTLEKQASSKA